MLQPVSENYVEKCCSASGKRLRLLLPIKMAWLQLILFAKQFKNCINYCPYIMLNDSAKSACLLSKYCIIQDLLHKFVLNYGSRACAFSHDGTRIAIGQNNGEVILLDGVTMKALCRKRDRSGIIYDVR